MSAFPIYYEGGIYTPDPWPTTWVPRHFPEHHYPLEHFRHSISHALSEFGHDMSVSATGHTMVSPRVDCRESRANYYFDIELPGVDNTEHLTLRWLGSRTLLIKAVVSRKPTPEDEVQKTAKEEPAAGDGNKGEKAAPPKTEQKVFLTMSERRIGLYGRALGFSVDVDHDKTVAKLEAGILRLTVPKIEEGKKLDMTVKVEHDVKSPEVK